MILVGLGLRNLKAGNFGRKCLDVQFASALSARHLLTLPVLLATRLQWTATLAQQVAKMALTQIQEARDTGELFNY